VGWGRVVQIHKIETRRKRVIERLHKSDRMSQTTEQDQDVD